jgi:SAM-dependent methyltransferase
VTSSPVYDTIGHGYTANRQPDPRWAALIHGEIGAGAGADVGAGTASGRRRCRVVNIGAGTGSYEPTGALRDADGDMGVEVDVVAVEPSAVMVAQRPPGAAPCVRAGGAALPLADGCADVAMAILTIHHWDDWPRGLAEMRRVAPRRLILTIDHAVHARFWLLDDYLPEVADYVRGQSPTLSDIEAALPVTAVHELALPHDLADGVLGAHWRRPEAYLDPVVRANTSPLALADPSHVAAGVERLRYDLETGAWAARYGELLTQTSYDLGYRLLVSQED